MKVKSIEVTRITDDSVLKEPDLLAIEEPLQIVAIHQQKSFNLAVTMRTPGDDLSLVKGFLFTENIVTKSDEIIKIWHCEQDENRNTVKVSLHDSCIFNANEQSRNFYASSSCGVCGKASVDQIKTICPFHPPVTLKVKRDIIFSLTQGLNQAQTVFKFTGGLHACALFSSNGELIDLKEDIGRHNALDKLLGAAFENELLPLHNHIVLLSGRAGFEMIQKSAMAGIGVIVALGAPSSLAADFAREAGISLIGFLKNNRMNIYSCPERII